MAQSTLATAGKRKILQFRDLPWLFVLIAHAVPLVVAAWVLLNLVGAGFEAAVLWAMRGAVNALVDFGTAADLAKVTPWLIALGAVFATQQVVLIVEPYLRERVRVAAGFALKNAALCKIGRLSVETFEVERTHDLIHRVAKGADTRGPELVGEALGVIRLVPLVVVSAVVLGLVVPWLPVLIVGGDAFFLWYGTRIGAQERRFELERTRQRRLADYYASLLTARAYAAEVRLWGLCDEILRRWRDTLADYFHGKLRVVLKNSLQGVGSSVGFVVLLVGALVAVTLFGGRVEPGIAALVLIAIRNVCAGMYLTLRSARSFIEHVGYASDLRQLLEGLEPEEPDRSPERVETRETAREVPPYGSGSHPWLHFPRPIRRGIRLQGVSYRYPGADRHALSGIDVEIKAGEVVALVGSNGAGKTTLASILLGLRSPTAGAVLVDGVDLACIRPAEIRRACTAVFQHPVRYPASLRENVALGASGSANALVEEILAMVGLDGHAADLDVLLGPEFGGVDLSGGQWQRVAIARGIFRGDAELVVFDEPTAALDPLAELDLFEQFATLAAGRTTILVSHRLGPARLANRVLVLEAGRLVEEGSPNQLLAVGGRFARMFAAQEEWYR